MKHVYLTQEEIIKSLEVKAITVKEADELTAQIKSCHDFYARQGLAA